MAVNEEILPVVDANGTIIGCAPRKLCHDGSMLLHPVVHLHVMRKGGYIMLQKRSAVKDIQPGKWDTSVGGHVDYGESIEQALLRESYEEIGLKNFNPIPLCRYEFQSGVEHELINSFGTEVTDDYTPVIDPAEIDEVKFWHISEIKAAIGKGVFTPNFELEFQKISPYII